MSQTNSSISMEEVSRRIPTLQLIGDDRVRVLTGRLTQDAPEYFWEVPAATRYHHPICREPRGLWAHTLMLSTVIHRLGDSYTGLGLLDESDIDLAHAAAILHDQRKRGDPENPEDHSTSDHDLKMAEIVRNSPLEDRVADAVAAHMGPFTTYRGPPPESHIEMLVHTADMIASTESITLGIQGPIPKELRDLGLEEVDLR